MHMVPLDTAGTVVDGRFILNVEKGNVLNSSHSHSVLSKRKGCH